MHYIRHKSSTIILNPGAHSKPIIRPTHDGPMPASDSKQTHISHTYIQRDKMRMVEGGGGKVWANSNTYQSENGEKYPSIHRAAGPAILNLGSNSCAFFLCNLAYLLAIGLSFLPLPPLPDWPAPPVASFCIRRLPYLLCHIVYSPVQSVQSRPALFVSASRSVSASSQYLS